MLTLMTALLIGQLTSDECLNRQFIVNQEECIYRFAVVKNLRDVLPAKQVMLIHNMGCGRYECRELATEILSEPTSNNLRAVFWGTHHKDAEIANRCQILLNKMTPCSHCLGSGECLLRQSPELSSRVSCESCHNTFINTDDARLNEVYNKKSCVKCMGSGTSLFIYIPHLKEK